MVSFGSSPDKMAVAIRKWLIFSSSWPWVCACHVSNTPVVAVVTMTASKHKYGSQGVEERERIHWDWGVGRQGGQAGEEAERRDHQGIWLRPFFVVLMPMSLYMLFVPYFFSSCTHPVALTVSLFPHLLLGLDDDRGMYTFKSCKGF